MQLVPVQPIPNQTLQAQLNNQACTLNVYQFAYGVFMDLYVGAQLILAGVPCQNLNRIVRDLYLGFVGDFVWVDLQGNANPFYTGFGTRFVLAYLAPADLPGGEG